MKLSEIKQQLIKFVILLITTINKLFTIRVIATGLGHSSEIKQKEKKIFTNFFIITLRGDLSRTAQTIQ